MFHSLTAARLIFMLGIVNLTTGLLILFTCRCIPGSKVLSKLTKFKAYDRIFSCHCYIWCIFWPSVITHAFLAIIYYGWPG